MPIAYEDALAATARACSLRDHTGPTRLPCTAGSMVTEKAYVLASSARGAGTKHIDYNGACAWCRPAPPKDDVRHDRATNPGPISRRRRCADRGVEPAECAPITTYYLWQCRERGGRLIVMDPRLTPITRNADLYLPVRPARTWPCSSRCSTSCPRRLVRSESLRSGRPGSTPCGHRCRWTPARAGHISGPPDDIVKAAHWIGERTARWGFTRADRAPFERVENCPRC